MQVFYSIVALLLQKQNLFCMNLILVNSVFVGQ